MNSGKRAKRKRQPAAPRPCSLRATLIPIRKRRSPNTNDRRRKLPVAGGASRAPTWATRVRNSHFRLKQENSVIPNEVCGVRNPSVFCRKGVERARSLRGGPPQKAGPTKARSPARKIRWPVLTPERAHAARTGGSDGPFILHAIGKWAPWYLCTGFCLLIARLSGTARKTGKRLAAAGADYL